VARGTNHFDVPLDSSKGNAQTRLFWTIILSSSFGKKHASQRHSRRFSETKWPLARLENQSFGRRHTTNAQKTQGWE
jgi:hypothetical protein